MKKFLKMFGAAGLVAGMLMVGGCGDSDNPPAAQGKVVKGPVFDAEVKDSKGDYVGKKTDKDGNFPMIGTAPYYSTGGTYIPLKADGTPGTAIAAPPMSTPAGVSQITPLSTLVNQATIAAAKPTATDAEKDNLSKLLAVINANGGLKTDLSEKTTANSALLNMNEIVGAVLASVAPASLSTAETAMIAALSSLTASATNTTAAVLNAVSTQLTLTLPAQATVLNAAATTAATGTTAVPLGPLPTTTTPVSTGSTGSGGGTAVK